MRRLGVLGGTFDPIHKGHIALAQQALHHAQLDQVLILPMARPAHREAEATVEQRMEMCRLAIENCPGLVLSCAGVAGSSRYTTDTLNILRREYPDAAFSFIMGADKLPSLPYWHEADRLFSMCSFLCFTRPGIFEKDALEKARAAGAKIDLLPSPGLPYSSTLIRSLSARYEDAQGLDEGVLAFMAEQGLYQQDFLPRLKGMMNPRRFKHTLGVRKEAVRLARIHHLPLQKAALAGLLHDCAKGMPLPVLSQIAREHHLVADEEMLSSGAMLHGPVGAHVARSRFGIRDEEVLHAIGSHTIGRPGMSLLEICIFVADATEEGREDYDGLAKIRELAEISLPAAALQSLKKTQEYVEKNGRPFFSQAKETAAYLESLITLKEKMMMI
ncbi:MAG: nicotinate (nicotinamide) nucleotide adenylyltransferase [Clostridiales bacterium]|nr:nicotinate (nicotinamide) nucleotide adenylyltransferase [Clostridiales bacterium]